ncbi:hypothetical protein YC2023_021174 [Brassica napus]
MVSDAQLTLTSMANGKFRVFPYTNISQARAQDLCTLVFKHNQSSISTLWHSRKWIRR